MDKYWVESEKIDFVDEIKEELKPREEALWRMKDGKIDRDRRLKQDKHSPKKKTRRITPHTSTRVKCAGMWYVQVSNVT